MVTIGSDSSLEAELKKMILEQHGITVFLPEQYTGAIAPHITSYGGAGAVRIQVPKSQAAEARRLLSERENQN